MLVKNPGQPFPFWARIWPASRALSDFLISYPEYVSNRKLLEIGAGIGLPSFSIAQKAVSILISDHDPAAVALLKKNITALGLVHASALCIDWNDFPTGLSADTILLSDVNYDPEQFDVLLTLIRNWIDAGSTVILSTPQRIMGIPFVAALSNYITHQTTSSIAEAGGVIDISIFVLEKRKTNG